MGVQKPIIMVSSSVYGIRPLLGQIFSTLEQYGYEVWMSNNRTIPVDPRLSNRDNCLDAVENCELFLGVITPFYGSGVINPPLSITHEEQRRAIEDNKLRWFLVHSHVVFARQLLRQYRFKQDGSPKANFQFKKTALMDNVGVIDMYDEAVCNDIPTALRTGNWVQEYSADHEALQYITTQFKDVNRIRKMMRSGGHEN